MCRVAPPRRCAAVLSLLACGCAALPAAEGGHRLEAALDHLDEVVDDPRMADLERTVSYNDGMSDSASTASSTFHINPDSSHPHIFVGNTLTQEQVDNMPNIPEHVGSQEDAMSTASTVDYNFHDADGKTYLDHAMDNDPLYDNRPRQQVMPPDQGMGRDRRGVMPELDYQDMKVAEDRFPLELTVLALTLNADGDSWQKEIARKTSPAENLIPRQEWIMFRLAQVVLEHFERGQIPDIVFAAMEELPSSNALSTSFNQDMGFLTMPTLDDAFSEGNSARTDSWKNWPKLFLEKYEVMQEPVVTGNAGMTGVVGQLMGGHRRVGVASWRLKKGQRELEDLAHHDGSAVPTIVPAKVGGFFTSGEKKAVNQQETHNSWGTKATVSIQSVSNYAEEKKVPPVHVTFSGSHLDAYKHKKIIKTINSFTEPLTLDNLDKTFGTDGQPWVHLHLWAGDFNPRHVVYWDNPHNGVFEYEVILTQLEAERVKEEGDLRALKNMMEAHAEALKNFDTEAPKILLDGVNANSAPGSTNVGASMSLSLAEQKAMHTAKQEQKLQVEAMAKETEGQLDTLKTELEAVTERVQFYQGVVQALKTRDGQRITDYAADPAPKDPFDLVHDEPKHFDLSFLGAWKDFDDKSFRAMLSYGEDLDPEADRVDMGEFVDGEDGDHWVLPSGRDITGAAREVAEALEKSKGIAGGVAVGGKLDTSIAYADWLHLKRKGYERDTERGNKHESCPLLTGPFSMVPSLRSVGNSNVDPVGFKPGGDRTTLDTTYVEGTDFKLDPEFANVMYGQPKFTPTYPNPNNHPTLKKENKPRMPGYADRVFARLTSVHKGAPFTNEPPTLKILEYESLVETDTRPHHHPATAEGDHAGVYSLVKVIVPMGWGTEKLDLVTGFEKKDSPPPPNEVELSFPGGPHDIGMPPSTNPMFNGFNAQAKNPGPNGANTNAANTIPANNGDMTASNKIIVTDQHNLDTGMSSYGASNAVNFGDHVKQGDVLKSDPTMSVWDGNPTQTTPVQSVAVPDQKTTQSSGSLERTIASLESLLAEQK